MHAGAMQAAAPPAARACSSVVAKQRRRSNYLASGSSSSAPPSGAPSASRRGGLVARRAFPSISGRERDDATPATSVPEDTVRAFDRYFGDADAGQKNGATDRELSSAASRADEDDEEYFDGDTEDVEPEENPVLFPATASAALAAWFLYVRAREDRKNPKRRANKDKDAATSRSLNPKELKRRFQEKRAARVAENESKRAVEAAARAKRREELRAAAKIEAAEAEAERALRSAEALERDATRRQMIDEAKVRAKTEAAARAKARRRPRRRCR